jgi:prephenate dehydrogenase
VTRRAALLGTGLIGASIGIALREAGWDVTGWDPDPGALSRAGSIGAFDRRGADTASTVQDADLVVLAGPVSAIVEAVGTLETTALVIDVAGVKAPVIAASHLPRFVGSHPMAGRETSGPEGASGSMFRGATWVVTEDGADEDDLVEVERIVRSLGADPLRMSATEHDSSVALASHVPHVTAAALVRAVADDPRALDLAAGGFRDLTRVALSETGWWSDVLTANGAAVSTALRELAGSLASMADLIDRRDGVSVGRRLAESRRIRAAMTAPAETIGVILEDRPGEMARVGHALSESGVDLRDLQLRHAVHGGGGVLTLSVRTGEADQLRKALEEEGFALVSTG